MGEDEMLNAIVSLAGSLTTNTLLFLWMYLERKERLRVQAEKDEQAKNHLAYVKEQLETK